MLLILFKVVLHAGIVIEVVGNICEVVSVKVLFRLLYPFASKLTFEFANLILYSGLDSKLGSAMCKYKLYCPSGMSFTNDCENVCVVLQNLVSTFSNFLYSY